MQITRLCKIKINKYNFLHLVEHRVFVYDVHYLAVAHVFNNYKCLTNIIMIY